MLRVVDRARIFRYGLLLLSGWFALLSPIVAPEERGRFFGRLRLSWTVVAIVFAGICALFLSQDTPVVYFQAIIFLIAIGSFVRILSYRKLPEKGIGRDGDKSAGADRRACVLE